MLLKEQLQSELDLAAGGCSGDHAGGWTEDGRLRPRGGTRALLRAGAEDNGIRCHQVGVIEHVEEFRAELRM